MSLTPQPHSSPFISDYWAEYYVKIVIVMEEKLGVCLFKILPLSKCLITQAIYFCLKWPLFYYRLMLPAKIWTLRQRQCCGHLPLPLCAAAATPQSLTLSHGPALLCRAGLFQSETLNCHSIATQIQVQRAAHSRHSALILSKE